jgi:cytochrome c biogenesis protein CcdA
MTPQIGLLGALLGGLLSLISPCSALLLPSFFAYAFERVSTLLARTAVFYLGLTAVLVPLGAGVGAVGSLLTRYRGTVTQIGGIVLIVLGALIVGGRGFGLSAATRWMGRLRIGSMLSVLALGAVYGLAGFCAGPLLGSVLTVSAAGGSAAYGGLLMGIYALGMAVPLFVMALIWDRLHLGDRRWLRGRTLTIGPFTTHTTSLISGILFAGIGILFLTTDGTANIGGLSGVDTQYHLQTWLQNVAGTVSDAGVLLIAAVTVLVILLLRILLIARRATADHPPAADPPPSPSRAPRK